tara:strand:- start:231 stop:1487 length:1257 start_codon:yes stop_codon:yes gene_type:complete
MNKFYFVICALLLSSSAFGQCEVDYDFGDVGFGISPDPTIGEYLEAGVVNQEYIDVIHILIPAFASDIDPDYPPTLPIDSVLLESVVLTDNVTLVEYSPEELGLEVICNNLGDSNNPCSFFGATQYCVSLEGVPNTAGVYEIDLNVLGWLTIFEPFSTPLVFSDFILNVQCDLVENIDVTNVDSDAGTLGSIDVTVNESVTNATFSWTDADGNVVGSEVDLTDVGVGNYMLTIVWGECTSYFENNVVVDTAVDCALSAEYVSTGEVNGNGAGSIDVTISGANGETTFLWTDANGVTVGTDEDLSNLFTGSYSLLVTDEDGCTFELSGVIVDNIVSINDFNAESVWVLQPNPANDSFTIRGELFVDTKITVLDVSGRIVLSETLTPNYNWDVSLWNEGVYFIQLSGEFVTNIRRLVVQH